VIHGLREGEAKNVIASPKTGKSSLTIDLALADAAGRPWLGRFETVRVAEAETDGNARREVGREEVPVHEERAPDRAAGGGDDREGTPERVDAVDGLAATGGSVERPWMDLVSA
jgi:hypothetical protein